MTPGVDELDILLPQLDQVLEQMTPAERLELDRLLLAPRRWDALPGPQTDALNCVADMLLYGGAAGGGKTDLMLGKAMSQHHRSLILRREYPQLAGIIERSHQLYMPFGKFNETKGIWRFKYDNLWRAVEMGSCPLESDKNKYQGRPHDLIGYDEAASFMESQVVFIGGWLRSEIRGQRCQELLASNPPTGAEGDWLFTWFAPWLDPKAERPALPGELRYFVRIEDRETEVPDNKPVLHKGETLVPRSRTFIPARVTDNPYYVKSGYVSKLQSLPEPMRSQMLYGDFRIGRADAAYQIIPTAWVEEAQERWLKYPKPDMAMSRIGLDVARGGKDNTVLSPRHGHWFAKQISVPGKQTPDGPSVARLVIEHRRHKCAVNIDVIGVGASPYDSAKGLIGESAVPMNGSSGSHKKDRTGLLKFVNKRAEWYWNMREYLDPQYGEDIMLPPDPRLKADLCAGTFKMTARGIQVEDKKAIADRIGRSPDYGDSAVYAMADESDGWIYGSIPLH